MLLITTEKVKKDLLEDGRLWNRMQKGERTALSSLFHKYYPLLLNYGMKLLPDEDLAKDSIQELFLSLWEQRKNLSDTKYVRSYLLSAYRRRVYKLANQQGNREKREKEYFEDSFTEMLNEEEVIIGAELRNEQKQIIKDAINQLGKRQKEAVYLKFFNGLTNDEISRVMGIHVQSVYNHISRALQTLQESLKKL